MITPIILLQLSFKYQVKTLYLKANVILPIFTQSDFFFKRICTNCSNSSSNKLRSRKEKVKILKELEQKLEYEKKLRRILLVSFGVNTFAYLLTLGGTQFIDTDYIGCGTETGLHYLDDMRLRNIINDLYSCKRKGKIIYITATALCHLAHRYGKNSLALPFALLV